MARGVLDCSSGGRELAGGAQNERLGVRRVLSGRLETLLSNGREGTCCRRQGHAARAGSSGMKGRRRSEALVVGESSRSVRGFC